MYRATKQHAFNLARFVAIYKTALLLQKTLSGGKERKADTFFAGLVGGWFVFGERNAVNEQVRAAIPGSADGVCSLLNATNPQIVLYVVSRVITSFLPRAGPPVAPAALPHSAKTGTLRSALPPPPGAPYPKPRPPNAKIFEIYAALTWGAVMYLFKERRDTLQGGMINSMQVRAVPVEK